MPPLGARTFSGRLRYASLGSGSRGNATLIEHDGTRLLVDCGFSLRETRRRLARLGRESGDLTAIVVTHEHSDHIDGVGPLAREAGIPVWMTQGTWLSARERLGSLPQVNFFGSHDTFSVGGLEVQPFPVPHDAREPCQFTVSDGARRIGILTDTGAITAHIEKSLEACNALLIEFNHDARMLREGPYPAALKERIAGPLGHLDNDSAAQLLNSLDCSRLASLAAMHLSETNNSPRRVRAVLDSVLGADVEWALLADQDEGLPWQKV